MTWLRVGDTTFTDPRLQALADPTDPRLRNEAVGFLVLVASLCALHHTDYRFDHTTALMVAGERTDALLRACTRAGLIAATGGRGRNRTYQLLQDKNLLHMILKKEDEWKKQQRSDTDNPTYREACALRDGDACRWCRKPVQPHDNRSARGRILDHLRPWEPANSAAGLVTACRGCNGRRAQDWQTDPDPERFAARWAPKLLPPPTQLIYVRSTVTWLAERNVAVPADAVILERATEDLDLDTTTPALAAPNAQQQATDCTTGTPPTTSDPGAEPLSAATAPPRDPAASRPPQHHPATRQPAGPRSTTPRPGSQPAPAAPPHQHHTDLRDRSDTARSGTTKPGRVGTGRDGWVTTHPPEPPAHPIPDSPAPHPRAPGETADDWRHAVSSRPRTTPASVAEYRSQRASEMTEAELLAAVRAIAKAEGWRCYHTHRSDRSEPGWPDLVLVRNSALLIRELKTERGRTTAAQDAWIQALAVAGVDVGVWRPVDLFERRIERVLQGGP